MLRDALRLQTGKELEKASLVHSSVSFQVFPEDDTNLLARVQRGQRDFRPVGVLLAFQEADDGRVDVLARHVFRARHSAGHESPSALAGIIRAARGMGESNPRERATIFELCVTHASC